MSGERIVIIGAGRLNIRDLLVGLDDLAESPAVLVECEVGEWLEFRVIQSNDIPSSRLLAGWGGKQKAQWKRERAGRRS